MTYVLIIDKNPRGYKNRSNDTDFITPSDSETISIDLKATDEKSAITESEKWLISGRYVPQGIVNDKISGRIYFMKDWKHISTITVTFDRQIVNIKNVSVVYP